MSDWITVLKEQCESTSQAQVAAVLRQPDKFPSPTAINQVLKGKYPSEKGRARLQAIVEGAYMNRTIDCPIVGEIPSDQCQEYQSRPFANSNPTRVQLYKKCNGNCAHSNKNKEA